MNFGWHLQTAICTSTKMTVASRAVAMAVMTEARAVDEEQERLALTSYWLGAVVNEWLDSADE